MIFVILANCTILALYDPLDYHDERWRNTVINSTESLFTALFTFEAVVKIVALDFFGQPNGYLSDRWNWCVQPLSNCSISAL